MSESKKVSLKIPRRDFMALSLAGGLSACFKPDTISSIFASSIEVDSMKAIVDFPVLAADRKNNVWLGTLERTDKRRSINLYNIRAKGCELATSFSPEGSTALGTPAIAVIENGCVISMPVERDGRWQIAYSFVEPNLKPKLNYIDCGGTSNISPSMAVVNNQVHIVWESNAGNQRSIYHCVAEKPGYSKPQMISVKGYNSYNPDIVAFENGNVFAAWDSIRNNSGDIFGRMMEKGKWQPEKRITGDVRIERHPRLCTKGKELWISWQAHSCEDLYEEYFKGLKSLRLNSQSEQIISVARITDKGLAAPKGLYHAVSGKSLLRPQIAFAPDGSLYLSARESISSNGGWLPVLWRYASDGWSEKQTLCDQQGRWRGVAIAASKESIAIAYEKDNIPNSWGQMGDYPAWTKQLEIENISVSPGNERLRLEKLEMPHVDYSLEEKSSLFAAELPRQRYKSGGQELTLFWGSLHNHTDISVCQRAINPPGHDLLANERDIIKNDFCAITDHAYNLDRYIWEYHREQVRCNNDPGNFLAFLGQEWTSNSNPPVAEGEPRRYGHHNIIYSGDHEKFYDAYDGDISPAEVWKELKDAEYLFIPHQIADNSGFNPPKDWSFVDERRQPVAEMFQARGSYEYLGCPMQSPTARPDRGYYIQDVWARGEIIGVIASPDHGGGNGLTGVWAKELTRKAIFDAIRKRHTFGTSGAKMALRFSSGANIMGDKTSHPGATIKFEVEATSMREITELVIFRNNEIVHRINPGTKELNIKWTDENCPKDKTLWYYTRIQARSSELAWSSPIWFMV